MSIYVTRTDDPKIMGVAHAIEKVIGEAFFFDLNTVSMFDFMERKKPKLVLLEAKDIPKAHIEYVKADYPDTKFVLFANGSYPIRGPFDLVINTKDKDHEWYLPSLVDTVLCSNGDYSQHLACDFAMFTDHIDPDNQILKEWLEILGQEFSLKLFGNKKIDCSYYAGQLQQDNVKHLYKSIKGLLMVEDSNVENCLANSVAPIKYSFTKDGEYDWDNLKTLGDICGRVLKDNKDSYGETSGTYIEFVERIKEGLGI